jgi:hypothetical protein
MFFRAFNIWSQNSIFFLASKFMVKILCTMVKTASPILRSTCSYKCVCGPFFMFCGVFSLWSPNSIIVFGI